MLWLCYLISFGLIGQSLSDFDVHGDPTYEFLKKSINYKIHPCDNFYDHVCPYDIKREDIPPYGVMNRLIETLEKEHLPSQLEKDLSTVRIQDSTTQEYDQSSKRAAMLMKGLRLQPALDNYIQKHDSQAKQRITDLDEEFGNFSKILIEQLLKTEKTTLSKEVVEKLVHYQLKQVIKTPENVLDGDQMLELYANVSRKYESFLQTGSLTKNEYLKVFAFFLADFFGDGARDLSDLLISFQPPDSEWNKDTNTINIFNAFTLLGWNSTRSIFIGAVLSCVGHELIHPIIYSEDLMEKLDPKIIENRQCIQDHFNRVHLEYILEENHGQWNNETLIDDTHFEDIPDYEGLQAAYVQYKKEFVTKGNEVPYEDLKLTNDKLFFYAYASTWCTVGTDRVRSNVHSAPFIRVNAPLSLMNAFHETFQCKDHHRLAKLKAQTPPSRCNAFGDVEKKLVF